MAERYLVVLPTYNESLNLPQIVPAVLSQDPRIEVLVVDDNSPDGTGAIADPIAASGGCTYCTGPGNRGSAGPTWPVSGGGSSAAITGCSRWMPISRTIPST